MGFDKMQILLGLLWLYHIAQSWFGDYRSLRFCAFTSVGALFYYF